MEQKAQGCRLKVKHKNPRQKRKIRIRKDIHGTNETPRIAVFRSNKNIYVQAVNDLDGKTLVKSIRPLTTLLRFNILIIILLL